MDGDRPKQAADADVGLTTPKVAIPGSPSRRWGIRPFSNRQRPVSADFEGFCMLNSEQRMFKLAHTMMGLTE